MKKLFEQLQSLQNEVIDLVSSVSEKDYHQQFHPDLSPLGWHLGHCVYTELYWVKEQLHAQQTINDSLKSLYVPELSHKPSRSLALPDRTELLTWAKQSQSENRDLLASAIANKISHHLLENNFLIYFLIQHYSQHIESMTMVLTEMQLQQFKLDVNDAKKIKPRELKSKIESIEASTYNIGSDKKELAYDNEQPAHLVTLNRFKISTLPVSNSEFLEFISSGGYSEKECWSNEGWQWIKLTQYKHPHHWRLQNDSLYYGIDHNDAYSLEENDPVYGLSYYEAEAYANWHGGRLPHEHEWEVASVKNVLQQSSQVWEWCSNALYPYKGFAAYPYEGYSVPYFDGKHYVIKGGSKYSKKQIKRSSFRNYYLAGKRHIFAGVRVAYN